MHETATVFLSKTRRSDHYGALTLVKAEGPLSQKVQNEFVEVITYDVPGNPLYGKRYPAIRCKQQVNKKIYQ